MYLEKKKGGNTRPAASSTRPSTKTKKKTTTEKSRLLTLPPKEKEAGDDLLKDVAFLSSYCLRTLKAHHVRDTALIPAKAQWELSLMEHILHRQRHYALPGIDTTSFSPYMFALNGLGPTVLPNQDPVNQNPLSTMTGAGTSKNILSGRYNVYTGLINDSVTLPVGPNSTSYYTGYFRPDFYGAPIVLLNHGDDLDLTDDVITLDWTENPFFGTPTDPAAWTLSSFVGSSKVPPGSTETPHGDPKDEVRSIKSETKGKRRFEVTFPSVGNIFGGTCTDLLTHVGGYDLTVCHTNKTAYTNCAFKLRTSTNTIHDFFQLYDSVVSNSINMGTVDNFVPSSGFTLATSGNRWTFPYYFLDNSGASPIFSDPDSWQAVNTLMNSFWNDWPVFQVQVTNSGPDVSSIALSFNAKGWHGVAPLSQEFAGAMPFETAPFRVPTWPSASKTVGSIHGYRPSEQSIISNLTSSFTQLEHPTAQRLVMSTAIPRLPALRPSGIKPGRALAIKDQPSLFSRGVSSVTKMAGNILGEAADKAAEGLGRRIEEKLSKAASSLLSAASNKFFGGVKAVEQLAPAAIEEVAELAPLL